MILTSLALTNGWLCLQPSCLGAERAPVNLAERTREDGGLFPIEQSRRFSSRILTEATKAGLMVLNTSKTGSRTNQFFAELRQNLTLEGTEPQLLDFFRNVGASDSPLRIRSFAVRPAPDRSRLSASVEIFGDYRVPTGGQSPEPDAAQSEYLVLSQLRLLRQAAFNCYSLTKSSLPSAWQLDSLNLQDGKRLSAQGHAPADQLGLLDDVRAKLAKVQVQDGKDLFTPSSGEATMRMAPGRTNFLWSMQFDLRPPELR
jgi:hypothetical protein